MSRLDPLDIPCVRCGANPGQPCRTKRGKGALKRPHAERVEPLRRAAPPPPCGTYAAYAAYMRDYRASRPDDYAHELRMQNAAGRALRKLARRHPEEYRAILDQERAS